MARPTGFIRLSTAVLAALVATSASASAQDQKELGWSFAGRLTSVFTSGNSNSSTFGLGGALRHVAQSSEFKLETGGVRIETGTTTRRAIGTSTSFRVEDETNFEKTAEAIFARARYDRSLSPHFVAFTGVDWLRNTFAGIDSRFLVAAGAGNTWSDRDTFRFKTDYGFTYTFQSDVVDNPFVKTKFPGIRVSYDIMRQFTESTKFESALISDLNLNDSDDIRFDWTNGLSIAISSVFAFRPGVQLLWRNQPALTEVDLFDSVGNPVGSKVSVPLDKLDTFVNLALVVTIK